MKKLLALLLLCLSVHANAEVIATMPNNANGLMYFTNTHCSGKSTYWKVVYSTYDNGRSIYGCWFFDDPMVHVEWNSGGTSAFHSSALTLVKRSGSYNY